MEGNSVKLIKSMLSMERIKPMLPFLLVMILAFYLLPLLIGGAGAGILILLTVIPVINFVCSFIFGLKYSFDIVYVILVVFLFIPTIIIFYNSTAFGYVIGYGIIALIANLIGAKVHKRSKQKESSLDLLP
jgi:hypothetical protein